MHRLLSCKFFLLVCFQDKNNFKNIPVKYMTSNRFLHNTTEMCSSTYKKCGPVPPQPILSSQQCPNGKPDYLKYTPSGVSIPLIKITLYVYSSSL